MRKIPAEEIIIKSLLMYTVPIMKEGQEQLNGQETKESAVALPQFGDKKFIDGTLYEYVDTGYTLREYFAHSTSRKGPGPGWDTRKILLDDAWAMERFGRTFSEEEVWNTGSVELPDLPYGQWEEVENIDS